MVEKLNMCKKYSAKLKEIRIKIISQYYQNTFSFCVSIILEIEML